MRVLVISTQWPTPERPQIARFVASGVERLRELGVVIETITFRGGKNPRDYALARAKVRSRLSAEPYDLVHAHYGQSAIVVPTGTRLVVSFYDNDLSRTESFSAAGWIQTLVGKRIARRAHAVILASERLSRSLPRGVNFHVVPPGIDLEVFRPSGQDDARRELGLPARGRFVLFYRASSTREDFLRAFEAVSLLRARLNIDLIALPDVPSPKISQYINACDILLATGRQADDALMAHEALACNVPVVAIDTNQASDVLARAEGCTLFSNDDPRSIADALEHSLTAPPPEHARDLVAEYAEDLVAARTREVYERVVSGARRGSD
jgi:glycosyltransferase involved in cell wall biosynthesis